MMCDRLFNFTRFYSNFTQILLKAFGTNYWYNEIHKGQHDLRMSIIVEKI